MTCCRPTKRWISKLDEQCQQHPENIRLIFEGYLDLFRDEPESIEQSTVEKTVIQNFVSNSCPITLPSVQKRLLLEALINSPSHSLEAWFSNAGINLSMPEIDKNTPAPKRFKALITEITDNYLNSNN